MSFRKRNVVVSSPRDTEVRQKIGGEETVAGTRPSPLDGRLTTSTGTRSLDLLLAGHAGLATGTSLLIEENGMTDFAGVLLRYFAAEGIVQRHHVHVLGMDESWGRELPGLAVPTNGQLTQNDETIKIGDRMKIAWRYERLGEFGKDRAPVPSLASMDRSTRQLVFCHEFDLTRHLALPSEPLLSYINLAYSVKPDVWPVNPSQSPFRTYLEHLESQIASNSPSTIHRVIIPGLLSPAIYPHIASAPHHVLQFLHSLRALTRRYPLQLSVMISLPTSLHHRTKGLARWIEILCDGTLEIAPFPSRPTQISIAHPRIASGQEEVPQGMLKVHRLPILHEKGGGVVELDGLEGDLAITLSRRKGLVIKPFSLPPVDADAGVNSTGIEGDSGSATKADLDF